MLQVADKLTADSTKLHQSCSRQRLVRRHDCPYPTLFACVALVATIMAFCLILVGQFNQRDGLLTIGFGLLAHALAYIGYTLYGHARCG